MRDLSDAKHSATKAVWAGEERYLLEGATQVPIVQSIPFGYDDLDEWMGVALGEREGHIYSRNTNPTTRGFEEKVRVLEGAEDSTSFASGMAAVSNTLYTFLKPGDRVVSVKDTYGGTNKVFLEFLPRAGVEVKLCDTTDTDAVAEEVAGAARCCTLRRRRTRRSSWSTLNAFRRLGVRPARSSWWTGPSQRP
jgi:cystathionine gamma-synthase